MKSKYTFFAQYQLNTLVFFFFIKNKQTIHYCLRNFNLICDFIDPAFIIIICIGRCLQGAQGGLLYLFKTALFACSTYVCLQNNSLFTENLNFAKDDQIFARLGGKRMSGER